MKKQLLFITFLFSVIANAQQLNFSYDSAGNQITRILCISCTGKSAKEIKEIKALVEEDLLKFSEDDVISYYPNPVKEELYLTWQIISDNDVKSIQVFTLTGQIIDSYTKLSTESSQNISFSRFPAGIYMVTLLYNNGDQKTIKIIKQ